MASGLLRKLHRLLPFATPGTPLIQDLLHLAAICLLLYYAPQIQEAFQRYRNELSVLTRDTADDDSSFEAPGPRRAAQEEQPVNDDVAIANHEGRAEAAVEQPDDVQLHEDAIENGQAGPAHANPTVTARNVGAKKAKALARREQRRAYHEFMRSQGDMQRARDAEGSAERENALAAERERRRAVAAELDAKRAREREERRAKEEQQRRAELERRELAITTVKEELSVRSMCNLFQVAKKIGGDADKKWVEKLLHAAGVLDRTDNTLTMVTTKGWVVKVTAEQMANLYIAMAEKEMGDENGKIEMDDLGAALETMLQA